MPYDEKSIVVLRGLDAVRRRPGMYIGDTEDGSGLHQMVFEVLDNAVDEALGGHCGSIRLTLHADGGATVEDDGRGIPVGRHADGRSALEVVMTELHAGGKFERDAYACSGGQHGVGVSVVNALSERLVAEVGRGGRLHRQSYHHGVPTGPLAVVGPTGWTGTRVSFWPDRAVMRAGRWQLARIVARLEAIAALMPGLRLELRDEREEGETRVFARDDGLAGLVGARARRRRPVHPAAIALSGEHEGVAVEVALQWTAGRGERVAGFANAIPNQDGGSHVTGLRAALTRAVNHYATERDLLVASAPRPVGEDVRDGLVGAVSVRLAEPSFDSQMKDRLVSEPARAAVEAVVPPLLEAWLEEHPTEARAIVERVASAARGREAARRARELVRQERLLAGSPLPGKLADCRERDPTRTELFIVEGESAGGTARQARDPELQAVLPLRGKILNVERARLDKVLASAELSALVAALGTGLGGGTDTGHYAPEKLRYHRIILMTDADIDGEHIRTLLLTFFWRQMPELVRGGHIYLARPPLFRVRQRTGDRYVADEAALEALEAESSGRLDVQRFKGLGEMSAEQLWATTMDPARRTLEQVGVDDAHEADRLFALLMGDDVAGRRAWIEAHAPDAEHLDV